ncbi:MAG: P-II family nitrogen regulator, partial [Verrucomicrobiota bacterium]
MTAILARASAKAVVDTILHSGSAHVLAMNARGSLMKEKWWHFFLPTLSPEQEILSFLVPESDTDHLMEEIAMAGKLNLYGSGAIYAINCDMYAPADDFPQWKPGRYQFVSEDFDIRFKENLVALTHIVDRGETDAIVKAAIKAGSQGPTISYVRGYGLRDRLGLLRITKNHDKEMITAVVDECDVDAVFDAMAEAGKINEPGRGYIYKSSVKRGLTNLAS